MTVQNVLEGAREIVANNWHQGSYGNSIDGYCIVGAVSEAAPLYELDGERGLSASYRSAYDALVKHLPDFGFDCDDDLPSFNDDINTTQEMVLALIDKALADETIG